MIVDVITAINGITAVALSSHHIFIPPSLPTNTTNTQYEFTVHSPAVSSSPAVLQASAHTQVGVSISKLLHDPAPVPIHHGLQQPPIIWVITADTQGRGTITLLSMASELRPSDEFVTGASMQEESLCLRTTLYASLHDPFYRLPERGAVYTPDVCVFRDTYSDSADAPPQNPAAAW
ncbi:hypothetical protein B0H17DRAFT_1207059 [Mycena rosella]|uniref:Microbial-type PARG catalytic domain-containing protein n=1 Tax=Mycena rosella TaxID=1033263 RepID=A0AAD7D7J7_MYCRO|nr:hypothetical protein B0H17DRAFT_1214296 [Mycena rosella]KAJ7677510.1 hypothetical protein B0H17DRAFT_1207059 [Mycena rosella]